ncbi:MAG TPA: 30S ribosomal protein S11 [Candidatus Gracilibacteria bacterium]|nr:30S ribosomal protein S11 [Candidatus Gracilibacteria bacterium]
MSDETTKTDAPEKEPKEESKAAEKKPAKEVKAKAEKSDEKAEAPKKAKKKPKKRLVIEGKAYIQASFNNTIVTIADLDGNVLTWNSAGASGFKGPKKATPYAAQVSAEKAAEKAKVYGLERVHVVVKGAGNGREQAIRGLHTGGLNIESIVDVTATPHNGCRPKKTRRI